MKIQLIRDVGAFRSKYQIGGGRALSLSIEIEKSNNLLGYLIFFKVTISSLKVIWILLF